jgi:hypothetical protein
MSRKGKERLENHPPTTVSRTVYWKAVRDMFVRMGGKEYSHTYIRECANGIKSVKDETMKMIRAAMDKVPSIPKNRINHNGNS